MMGSGESRRWSVTFNDIKRLHDAAYAAVDGAIKLEEEERPSEAIEKYKVGISLIDEALSTQIECPANPDFTWEKARSMIQKMKKSRGEILSRINVIQASNAFVTPEPPPSYEEAMSTSSTSSEGTLRTYSELAAALESLKIEHSQNHATIIFSHDDVKFYIISPDGSVSITNELQTLKIGITDAEPTISFLQVGEWVYPLLPGVSPCYRTEYGAYIFPDVHSEIAGTSIAIILPPEIEFQVCELLEDILHGIIREHVPEQPISTRARRAPVPGISGRISHGIITGAQYIHKGLIISAEKASNLIDYSTPKILNHVQPAHEAKPIPNGVQKGIQIAQNVTSTAVNVTGFVANKVGSATMALGKFLAPHIQKQGTKLLTTGFNLDEKEASEKVNGVLTVAAGAVEGFSTIYRGLETSAGILGRNLTDNTVKIVEYKYGHPSGVLAGNTLHTVGNLVNVSKNINYMTAKGIAKTAVKETGKAMVEDIRNDLKTPSSSSSLENHLYPDLNNLGPSTSKDFTKEK